jgi:beta-glucosidase
MNEFPNNFVWGAATSAYQIEGAPLEDGAGPSNWHRFSHQSDRTKLGHTGDIACDHYHRYRGDVALLSELGLGSYRFSISWSRVLPSGRGARNHQGIDFYSRLVDELLSYGIMPNVTLYHWDLPAALDDRGGWLNPDVADWFADYAGVVFRALDDRVKLWVTLNEPWVVTDGGYVHGVHAPGFNDPGKAPLVTHNLLRAHGSAVQAFRTELSAQIGIVVNLEPKYPATETAADLAATERADAYWNRQYLDPIFFGRYPDELRDIYGAAWPEHPDQDFELIKQPLDFVGINYYKRGVVRDDPTAVPARDGYVRQSQNLHTELDWEVFPPGLTRILKWVHERYGGIELYVTENGAAFSDPDTPINGAVHDPLRVAYVREHLLAALDAIADGVNLQGYYVWSLLDNFEWAEGYTKRFGIIHVDFETLIRTPKSSAHFYRDVVRSNGAALERGR